jgi:hypothetical protein
LNFTRWLCSLLLANLASLVLLNALRLRPVCLLAIYPAAVAGFRWWLGRARVRRARWLPAPWTLWVALAFVGLLAVPRLPYLLEWAPTNPVIAQADDFGHLAELVSMTLSERYPLRHPSNQDYLLSHYYTAFYPLAWLKAAAPRLTLKDCLLAGNALYHFLLVMSLIEVATRWLPSRRGGLLLLFLATFFGGWDWLFYARLPFNHSEHWPRLAFHAWREVSSHYTALFWVVHHFAAFWCVVAGYLLARYSRLGRRWEKPLLVGLLLVAGVYSSAFVLLPVPLLFAPELWLLARRVWRTRMVLPLAAVFSVPLFLYFGRAQHGAFRWAPIRLEWCATPLADALVSLVVYVLAVCLVDFAGIPILLLAAIRRMGRAERRWLAGGLGFLACTWAVEWVGFNNFCMRGMMLPGFVFFFLFARWAGEQPVAKVSFGAGSGAKSLIRRAGQFGCETFVTGSQRRMAWTGRRRALAAAVALALSWGTLREAAFVLSQPLMFSSWYWRARGLPPPAAVARRLRPAYPRLARDPAVRYYVPDRADRVGLDKFNAEKLVRGIAPGEMNGVELELLRAPLNGWLW